MKKSTELVFIPAPGMGHLVPMVELAKKLVDRDDRLTVTFLILKLPIFTTEVVDAYIESLTAAGSSSSIRFIKLPALQENSFSLLQSASPGLALLCIFIEESKPHIQQTITKLFIDDDDDNSSSDSGSSACSRRLGGLVIDFFFTTLIDVGNKLGVPTYLHFASSAAMLGFMLHCPALDLHKLESEVIIPSYVNPVPYSVLPVSFLNKGDDMYHYFLYNARRFKETKGIMVNSFYSLETHAFNSFSDSYQGQIPPVYPVGPVLDLKAGQDQLQPDRARLYDDIMTWLDDQPPSSVILLCFGSIGSFEEPQVKEIAIGLERSGQRFLWSLRQPSKAKFGTPNDYTDYEDILLPVGFLERTKGRGLVCGWIPQVAVLGHQAVGGFVSHCGWNSTLESIWFGVPMLTWPLYAEQQLNAFELVKELGLSVELRLDYKMMGSSDLVLADEVERGVRCLMDVDQSEDVRKKVKEMMEKSRKAVSRDNNGCSSSFSSMGLFIEDLMKDNI